MIATCRNPESATELQALKEGSKGLLYALALDVSDQTSIFNSVKLVQEILGEKGLDYLYNNAGIALNQSDHAFNCKYTDLMQSFQSNVAGPALMSQLYLRLLEKGQRKVIVNVTSGLASIGSDRGRPDAPSYLISKAALNMLTYKQAKARPDIIAIALAPGWTKTDLGGSNAAVEIHESVSATMKIVTGLTSKQSGKYLNYTGEELPWGTSGV